MAFAPRGLPSGRALGSFGGNDQKDPEGNPAVF